MRFQATFRASLAVMAALTTIACGGHSSDAAPPATSSPPNPGAGPPPPQPSPGAAPAPEILGFSLQFTGTFQHRLLVLVGGGFQTGAAVTFNGVKATSVGVDPAGSSIICLTPFLPAGSVSVNVTNPDGQSATLIGSDSGAPPTAATGGTTGVPGSSYRFGGSSLSSPTVYFGTVPALIVSITARPIQVTVDVPSLASGTYEVIIVNADGQFATVEPMFVVP
jgi:hypothetical protein